MVLDEIVKWVCKDCVNDFEVHCMYSVESDLLKLEFYGATAKYLITSGHSGVA